ncbi:hypothetical protein [Brasilonema sp. UFV-L1]|uniref:hypothetical protein n=1 Tax=Brasilonema sp. UFV-L1 TaxID=2234130 RepID=UPI00145C967A|nr:hypothetical protein [Brasilonema sp. UFV-L1]NMG05612.1 hypothetical protein [Brasilonema sp. UFV-L1]
MGIPPEPFKDVRFCAAPRRTSHDVDPHLDQRADNISVYLWSIRELCRDRLLGSNQLRSPKLI